MCHCLPMGSLLIVLDIITMVSCVVTLVLLPATSSSAISNPSTAERSAEPPVAQRWM